MEQADEAFRGGDPDDSDSDSFEGQLPDGLPATQHRDTDDDGILHGVEAMESSANPDSNLADIQKHKL